jgi:hypothetical protein
MPRSPMLGRTRFAIVLFLALFPARALAAPPEAPPPPEHDLAFRSGLEQYAHGNFVAAITTWESLLRTMGEDRGYKVLYNLGLAYQAIGDVTRAVERYVAFTTQVERKRPVAPELEDRASDAQKRIDQIRSTYGSVNVLAPKRGGLVLTRVGTAEPRAAGYVVYLAPGSHVIEIAIGTDRLQKKSIEVEAGKTIEVDTSPPEEPAPPPVTQQPIPRPEESATPRNANWLWYGGFATFGAFSVPLLLHFVTLRQKTDAEELGPGHPDYGPAKSDYETSRTLTFVAYALPAVVAAVSIGGYYFSGDSKPRAAIGISPRGLSLSGSF